MKPTIDSSSSSKRPFQQNLQQVSSLSALGGRSASIIVPQNKNFSISSFGTENQPSPFSGYNSRSTNGSLVSSQNSRAFENPRENPAMKPYVKEIVQYEVNERYKILIEKNQILEEQLKQSQKAMQQLEQTVCQSMLDLQSQTSQSQHQSEVASNRQDDFQIEKLQKQYSIVQEYVDTLSKQVNGEIKQKLTTTIDGIRNKDQQIQSYLDQIVKKQQLKLDTIQQQLNHFSVPNNIRNSNGEKTEKVDEVTLQRLQTEQLQVKSEINELKFIIETNKIDFTSQLNSSVSQQLNDLQLDILDFRNIFTSLKSDLENKMENLNNSILQSNFNSQRGKDQNANETIDSLAKSVQQLQSQIRSSAKVEAENKELKERMLNFQRETSSQMEEMRKLILSNPQIMMEANKIGFKKQMNEDQNIYQEYSSIGNSGIYKDNQNIYSSIGGSESDLVEIATLGSMINSKSSENKFPSQFNSIPKKLVNLDRQVSFGNNSNFKEDWNKIYDEHQACLEEVINEYESIYSLTQDQKTEGDTESLIIQESQNNNLKIEVPDSSDAKIGESDKVSYNDMIISYEGIKDFFKKVNLAESTDEFVTSQLEAIQEQSHEEILKELQYSSSNSLQTNRQQKEFQIEKEKNNLLDNPQGYQQDEASKEEEQAISFSQEKITIEEKEQINKSPILTQNDHEESKESNKNDIKCTFIVFAQKINYQIQEQSDLSKQNALEEDESSLNESQNFSQHSTKINLKPLMKANDESEDILSESEEDEVQKDIPVKQQEEVLEDLQIIQSILSKEQEIQSQGQNQEFQSNTFEEKQIDKNSVESTNSLEGKRKKFENEEEEVIYQIDDNGFLMDENGNYILGDDGEMVKLGEEDLQYLRQANMLEEY